MEMGSLVKHLMKSARSKIIWKVDDTGIFVILVNVISILVTKIRNMTPLDRFSKNFLETSNDAPKGTENVAGTSCFVLKL